MELVWWTTGKWNSKQLGVECSRNTPSWSRQMGILSSKLADSEKATQSKCLMIQFKLEWEMVWKYANLQDSGYYCGNLEGLKMNC
jgi:hypothetical protein